jgi:hypothetical protein
VGRHERPDDLTDAESAISRTSTSLTVAREGAQNARPVCSQPRCHSPGGHCCGRADVLKVRVSSMWGPEHGLVRLADHRGDRPLAALGDRRLGPRSTGARPVDSGSGGDDPGVKQAIGGSPQAAADRSSEPARIVYVCLPVTSRAGLHAAAATQAGSGQPALAGCPKRRIAAGVLGRQVPRSGWRRTLRCVVEAADLPAPGSRRDRGEQRACFHRNGRAGRGTSTGTPPAGRPFGRATLPRRGGRTTPRS